MKYIIGIVALLVGIAIGKEFPDLDQETSLLLHRSIVTHGLLLPFVAFGLASLVRSLPIRWLVLGFSVGVAVHLSFDLFPRGWSGFALISVPTVGWTAPWFSWIWIALSTIVCTYLAMRLVRGGLEGGVFVLSLIGAFGYIAADEVAFWRPIVALTVATIISSIFAVRHAMPSDQPSACARVLRQHPCRVNQESISPLTRGLGMKRGLECTVALSHRAFENHRSVRISMRARYLKILRFSRKL